jgi:plastocyanin
VIKRSSVIPGALLLAGLVVLGAGTAYAGTITGTVTAKQKKYAANAVVYIQSVEDSTFKPPSEPVVMDQKNLEFIPHVLPIVAGTTVRFENHDNVSHNVFSPDKCAGKLNLGTWPPGESKDYTFKEAGCAATILCIVHPDMEAYVVVLQNPYYAVTGTDGSFTIHDVPAGKYTLAIWSEKLKAKQVAITVPESGNVKIGFNLN